MKKKSVKQILFFYFFLFMLSTDSFASGINYLQVNDLFKQKVVQTPEMSKLITNVKYPVNYSTGSVQIQIPIYTVQCGSLELPVYISYNTSGLKVDTPSGWVGEGWSLHAEPSIARNVMGHIDSNFKCKLDSARLKDYPYGYNYISDLLSGNPYSSNDSQPDQYCYDLGNEKGMFLYCKRNDNTYDYISFPYNDTKVNVTSNNQYFVMKDNSGNTYYFDGSEDRNTTYVIGWKASHVLSADDVDSICFNYQSNSINYNIPLRISNFIVLDDFECGDSVASSYAQAVGMVQNANGWIRDPEELLKDPVIINKEDNKNYYARTSSKYDSLIYENDYINDDNSNSYLTNTSPSTHRLSEISFKGNIVEFISADARGNNRLLKVKVINNLGNIIKTIDFGYLTVNGRDYLKSLSFVSGSDSISYKFQYNYPAQFPALGNSNKDFWGYYNGQNNDYNEYNHEQTLVPRIATYCEDGDSLVVGSESMYNRAADEDYLQKGMLSSIVYPTGVKDSFVYEANRIYLSNPRLPDTDFHMSDHLRKYSDGIYYAGGVRIKQIYSNTSDGTCNIRSFKYNDNGAGLSPINNDFNYFVLNRLKWYENYTDAIGYWTAKARCRTFYSDPVIPITYNNGASVMYQKVTEYQGTEDDNDGYTIYEYSMPDYTQGVSNEDVLECSPLYSSSDNSGSYNMDDNVYSENAYGDLLKKSIYKKNASGNFVLTECEKNEYANEDFQSNKIGSFVYGLFYFKNIADFNNSDVINKNDIYYQENHASKIKEVFIPKHYLELTETTLYNDGNDTIRTKTSYDYTKLLLMEPTSKEVSRNNEYSKEEYKYPSDYSSTIYRDMVNRNIVSKVVKTIYTNKNSMADSVKESLENNFENISSNTIPIYRPVSINYTYSNGKTEPRMRYLYNSVTGQPIQVTKDSCQTVTYLYGYNHQYLIGIIDNAAYSTVSAKLGSSTIDNIAKASNIDSYWSNLCNLQDALPNVDVKLFQYVPLLGVSKLWNSDKTLTNYIYDGFGRLVKTEFLNTNSSSAQPVESYEYHYKTQN